MMFALGSCGDKQEQTGSGANANKNENTNTTPSNTEAQQDQAKEELKSKEEANQDQASLEKQNDLGMTPGLPADFPKDVPVPMNSKTIGSLNSTTEGTVVTFESSEKVPGIVGYYKTEMQKNGYQQIEGSEKVEGENGAILNWKKDSREVGMMLGYDKDKSITSIAITYK